MKFSCKIIKLLVILVHGEKNLYIKIYWRSYLKVNEKKNIYMGYVEETVDK